MGVFKKGNYYLPRLGRVRIAAFPDEPEVERYLRDFLGSPDRPGNRTWEDLLADGYLHSRIVRGQPMSMDAREMSKTLVLPDLGVAEIFFEGAPRTLLFCSGPYSYVENRRTFAFRAIDPHVFRLPVDALAYKPDEFSLEAVYEALASLERQAATLDDKRALEAAIDTLRGQLEVFKSRRDPLAAVLPALSAEARKSEERAKDLQRQIVEMQRPEGYGATFPIDYPSRAQIDLLLSRKEDKGVVEAHVASKASQAELDTHVLSRNPHATGYADVGAAARAEFFALLSRFNALLARVESELANRITSLVGTGDMLVRRVPGAGGAWEVDGSLIYENGLPARHVEHRLEARSFSGGEEALRRAYAMGAGKIAGVVLSAHPSVAGGAASAVEATLEISGETLYETTVGVPGAMLDLPAPDPPLHLVGRGSLVEARFSAPGGIAPAEPMDVLLQLRIEED